MSRWREEDIDKRTREDLIRQIGVLSKVYTPEWEFSTENPDAGSVIALIFAGQMEKRIQEFNGAFSRYRLGLVNMLGLSLLPAVPAEGVIAMEMIPGAAGGVRVPAGSRFLADGEGDAPVVFETRENLCVSPARLTDIIGIEKNSGRILPWLGDAKPADLPGIGPKFADCRQEGIQLNGLLICFSGSISRPGEALRLKIGMSLSLRDPDAFEFWCHTGRGFGQTKPVFLDGETVSLQPDRPFSNISFENKEYQSIFIKYLYPVAEPVFAGGIGLAAAGTTEKAEYLSCGETELTGERIYPFGERIGLYEEFCVGSSGQFGRAGAKISLSFSLYYEDREFTYAKAGKPADLKPIRRKPRGEFRQEMYGCAVDAVALEYFNGTGWRKLTCDRGIGGLFDGKKSGEVLLSFSCPEDWENTTAGGYEGRILRFKITRADNCYMLPCRHRLPVISGLEIRSSYEGVWREPERVFAFEAAELREVTGELAEKGRVCVFSPIPWKPDCLYLGFDQKFTEGPVSFFLKIRENSGFEGMEPVYFYSAAGGFKRLEVVDRTECLTVSGTVMFLPPGDMTAVKVAGRTCFWLRIEEAGGMYPAGGLYPAVIQDIIWNAVEVRNTETRAEEDYYIEVPAPDMEFSLGNAPVLDAAVYVSEKGTLSPAAMKRMIREQPERVRVEYDSLGEIREFFVRWQETADFCRSGPGDRHYTIDRVNHLLKFGNGIHGKIPSEKNGTAFTVSLRCCDGEAGNVPAGAIAASASNVLFLDNIGNPAGTRGGNNMEELDHAYRRGTGVLNSRGRLVSRRDYVREALDWSDHIDKAACITGTDASGRRNEKRINLVLLMRDYKEGHGSFHHVRRELKRHLLKRCEAGIGENDLVIMEPLFVKIHTEIWVQIQRPEEAFDIQDQIVQAVERFIEPVSENGRAGWEIGVLPRESQIRRMLQSLRFDGYLRHLLVTGEWEGRGETELSWVRETPFVTGINGSHCLHLSFPGEQGGKP